MLLRAVVLLWCVVLWIRREAEPLEIERRTMHVPTATGSEAVPA